MLNLLRDIRVAGRAGPKALRVDNSPYGKTLVVLLCSALMKRDYSEGQVMYQPDAESISRFFAVLY